MKAFAAAAMMRVIRLGLQRQGLAPPAPSPAQHGALVPLGDKRALAEALWRRHGPLVMLRIGEAVRDAAEEPTLTALTAARDASDLIARWQRLERFIHSHHRVVTLAAGPGGCTLRHVSLRDGEPPTAAEDLLVFGLLVGLLQRIGCPGLRARFAGEAAWRQDGGRWRDRGLPVDVASWDIAWQPAPAAAVAVPEGAATIDAARAALAADCGAAWTLARLAAALGLGARTLQRRLRDAGASFSGLWTEVRLAQSARLLARGDEPPAHVGFACGFADQSHFTRCFKRATAMTPAVYRAQFSPAAPASPASR